VTIAAELRAGALAKVYVAGPYSAPSAHAVQLNVVRASGWATRFLKAGLAAFCPHTNYQDASDVSYEAILAADMAFLEACDAVFLMPGWEASPGANREKLHAEGLGIPVYTDADELLDAFQHRRQEVAA
jgi:nucleoside 2-deoxyribosyltransferase